MKQLMENWRKFVTEAEKEEQEKKDFKAHMMYDPKTGDGKMAKSHEEHLKLKDKGWTHDKPDIEEAKNKDGKEQGADGKACWKGYRYAGTDEDGKDKCVPMEEDESIQEYGDHETQAQGGMVSSSHSSDPELDHIADIARTVIEQGGGLHDLKQPLEAEAYDVSATNRFIIVKTTNGDIGIASAKNVELTGGEELIDTPYGQLAVGRISGSDEKLEEKPAKGKKSSKTYTNPKTGRKNKVSYGQKGAKISPGTSKGDSYCARSYGIKKGLSKDKQNDPNTPNNLSRKKWKCKGKKSTK